MKEGKYKKVGTQDVNGVEHDVFSKTWDVEDAVKADSAFSFYMSMNSHSIEASIACPSNTPGYGRVWFKPKGVKQNTDRPKLRFQYWRRRFRKVKIQWIAND